jgi:spermidine synthase
MRASGIVPASPMPSRTASASRLPEATISEFDGVRSLHLGTIWIQGSMRIARPDFVELDYVQRMLASLLWLPSQQLGRGRAVQLGLGAGAITRFTLKALRMHTIAVELNPAVIAVCRRAFHLPADGAKLQVLAMDAASWVHDPENQGSVQLLHVDLYDHEAAAPVLDDARFYAACRNVLAEGGVMPASTTACRRSPRPSVWRRCAACAPRARATAWSWPGVTYCCRIAPRCSIVPLPSRPAMVPGGCRRASGCACCGRWCRRHDQATACVARPRPMNSP